MREGERKREGKSERKRENKRKATREELKTIVNARNLDFFCL